MTAVHETQTETRRPTRAPAWRGGEPELHTLPSGNVALLRRPSLMEMMRRGEIPNPLIEAAVEMVDRRGASDYAQTADIVAFMVASAFVEPAVCYEGETAPYELPVAAISDRDRTYVLGWIHGAVVELAPFREDGAGAADGSHGGSVRVEAE